MEEKSVTLQNVAGRLRDLGINLSAQRIAIMKFLLNNRTHPTAEMVYDALHPSMPTLSLTTVYNTLRLMAAKGAVKALKGDHGMTHYDIHTAEHAHFYCRECGSIIDLNLDMDELECAVDLSGKRVEGFELSVRGLCESCKGSV